MTTEDDHERRQQKRSSSKKSLSPKRNVSKSSTGSSKKNINDDHHQDDNKECPRFNPKSRPSTRKKSSRRLLIESESDSASTTPSAKGHNTASMPPAAASAGARFQKQGEETKYAELGDMNEARASQSNSKHDSWNLEEILGGSREQLEEIFGESQPDGTFSFEDEEQVLEQYRIMAQHEAISRVKENTGFDMTEYEKKKKMNGEGGGGAEDSFKGGKRTKVRLPEAKRITSTNSTPKPEEPSMPVPRLNTRFLHQRMNRVPELCPGVLMIRGSSTMPSDEHAVQCLGCKGNLRVKILASLVSCPDCSTVSSASSTRR